MNNPISIVIISNDNNTILRENLPLILSQKYKSEYEVIVVRESKQGEIKDIIESLSDKFKNLKSTYLPDKPIYVTNEQVETLLAVKAASFHNIIIISPDFFPPSETWLENLAESISSFCPERTNTIILGKEHYANKNWAYKIRHSLKIKKFIRKHRSKNNSNIKCTMARGNLQNLFAIMFNKDEYTTNNLLRQIINIHITTY